MSEYTRLSNAYVKEDFVNNQEIRSVADPNYCLTVPDATKQELVMKLCDNTLNQKFTYNPSEKNKDLILIKPAISSGKKCIDLWKLKDEENQIVYQWDCNDGSNQTWKYDPNTQKLFCGGTTNKYLDIAPTPTSGSINNATIMVHTSTPSDTQKWVASSNCTLSPTPSDAPYGDCDAKQCNTTGTRSRNKYIITTPSAGLGSCPSQYDNEYTPCSAAPCPSATNCTLSPSNAEWGACDAIQCGTSGKQQRQKYKLDLAPTYGGTCVGKDDIEYTPCSATPCSAPTATNCVLSQSTDSFSPCSATACGTTGTQTRNKYIVKSPSMYGGTCDKEHEMETVNCSAISCEPSTKTIEDSFIEKYKWQMIGGVILFMLLIIIILVAKK